MIMKSRKLIVPLIAIMVSAVALAGVVYAYNATLTVDNNVVPADDLSIDLQGGSRTNQNVVVSGNSAITFTDNFTYVSEPAAKNNTVKYYANAGLLITYKLTITGEADANKLKISSADIASIYTRVIEDALTVGNIIMIKVGLLSDLTDAQELNAAGYAFDISPEHTTGSTNISVYVSVYAVSASGNVRDGAVAPNEYAADYAADIGDLSFTITFDAYKA